MRLRYNLAGTFAKDRFIVIKNKTNDPSGFCCNHILYMIMKRKNVFTEDGREQYMKEQWIRQKEKK